MAKMVGLSRDLKLQWLDKTVDLVISGMTENEIKEELRSYLSFEIKSPTNLRKTVQILMNLWVYPNEITENVRKASLIAIKNGAENRMPFHWCMLLLYYPVFADINGLIGNITEIQDTFKTSWLKDKMFEEWGERTTLFHSCDKILKTVKSLDAIKNISVGMYEVKKHPISDETTIKVFIETVIALRKKPYYELIDISHAPQMFPFSFEVTYELIYNSNIFKLTNFAGKIVLTD